MGEKDIIVKEKVKYSGLGDFKESYKFARDWFWKEDFNLVEDTYTEKISGNAKDIEIEWTATRKLTDYFKAIFKVKWRILGLTEVEVEIDGKRKKTNKFVEVGIEIKGIIEKDYDNKWDATPMYKFFKEIYNKYVIPARTEQIEDGIKNLAQDFKEEMKAFFDITGRK